MEQKNEYTKMMWEKTTIIKDMVHGYIEIPKPIMKEIVDSEQFQRLKDIEQTGMEALYPSATHKRFTHSLGVYHLAKKAFAKFRNNVAVAYPDIYQKIKNKKADDCEVIWTRWGILFQLAALLHDCGHSPFSHTLEFIYDLAEENGEKELDKKLLMDMSVNFKTDFENGQDGHCGKQHERMSALYIKTDDYSGFRSKVEKLLRSYMQVWGNESIYNIPANMDDDIEFMIRMIIGCRYQYDRKDEYAHQIGRYKREDKKSWYIELQLRNCIIGMLNSQLDVDNLDYVVRDSKFSGYANHTVDLERLLSSFTIVQAFQVTEMKVTRNIPFDYCINLKCFKGHVLNGRLTGESHIFCENKNIKAHGRIALHGQDNKTDDNQRIYKTTGDFSAELEFCGNENEVIEISAPREGGKKLAYIHFKGEMDGNLTGLVFANDYQMKKEESIDWEAQGELMIYFAYEQKCMSVLMSAVYNSNFEKKWIYAHHISTFTNDFLYIYLFQKYAEYIVKKKQKELLKVFDSICNNVEKSPLGVENITKENFEKMKELQDSLQWEENDDEIYKIIEQKNSNNLAITNNMIRELMRLCVEGTDETANYKQKFFDILKECCLDESGPCCLSDNTLKEMKETIEKYKGILTAEMQIFSDVLAMYKPYEFDGIRFYKTSDRDLLAAYKNLYMKIISGEEEYGEEFNEFKETYKELTERRYLKCLWKSQPEFEYYFSDWTKAERDALCEWLNPWVSPSIHLLKSASKAAIGFKYKVLSDNIKRMSVAEKEFWEFLKERYKIKRFVYVPQQIRTKKFVDYEMYMKRGYRVLRLKDIKLFNDDQQDLDFFYFYYEQSEQIEIDIFEMLDWMRKAIQK